MTNYAAGDRPITRGVAIALNMSQKKKPSDELMREDVGGTSLSDQVRSVSSVAPTGTDAGVTIDELIKRSTQGSKAFTKSEIRRGYRKL